MYIYLLRNAGTLFVPGLGFLVKGADNRTLRLFWCICGAIMSVFMQSAIVLKVNKVGKVRLLSASWVKYLLW